MTKFYHFRFGLVLLSVLLLAFAFSCREQPYNRALPNLAPDTFIGDVSFSPEGALSYKYTVTVQFSGIDRDSKVTYFEYHWGDEDWRKIEAIHTSTSKVLEFPTQDTKYDFYVRAIDEKSAVDNSPATVELKGSMAVNEKPSIAITDGPPAGAKISSYARFVIQGSDLIGKVEYLKYKLDDGSWQSIYPNPDDFSGVAELKDMDEGFHTFYCKSVDNFGEESKTLSRTFYSYLGNYFQPIVTALPLEGSLLLYPGEWPTIEVSATGDYYHTPIQGYSYSIDGGTTWSNYQSVPLSVTWSGFNRSADEIVFMYRVIDKGGNSVQGSLKYIPVDIVDFVGDRDILVINGMSPAYDSEIKEQYENMTYTAGNDYVLWDVHPLQPPGSLVGVPATSYIANGGDIPDILFDLIDDVIVGLWNNYEGDFDYWAPNETKIVEWLQEDEANHKFILNARYTQDFLGGDLADYMGFDNSAMTNAVTVGDVTPTAEGAALGFTAQTIGSSLGAYITDWEAASGGSANLIPIYNESGGNVAAFAYKGNGTDINVFVLCWRNYRPSVSTVAAVYETIFSVFGY